MLKDTRSTLLSEQYRKLLGYVQAGTLDDVVYALAFEWTKTGKLSKREFIGFLNAVYGAGSENPFCN